MLSKTLVAMCGWMLGDMPERDRDDPSGRQRTDGFFADLAVVSEQTASVTHAFSDEAGNVLGYIQLHRSGGEVTVHRIWTIQPGKGHGSMILGRVCQLADRHGVILRLKVAPLGAWPHPMTAGQLRSWYYRYGFTGERKMTRLPVRKLSHA